MKRKYSNTAGIENHDFVIRVRPFLDENGNWTGEIDLAIITQPGNDLDDDDYYQLMHFTKMMTSTVPIMESNESIRELVHDYVMNVVDKDIEVTLEDEQEDTRTVTVTNREGNVISIDFNTKGNA